MADSPLIPVAAPFFSHRELELITEVVESGWISSVGPVIGQFEAEFAERIGVARAETVANGTVALQVVLHAIGIGASDEVIVPSQTFVATAAAVKYCQAKPVFADICEGTWTLDPVDVVAKLTVRTKAVIPVDLFGLCADIPALRAALEKAGRSDVFILEDAAESFGSSLRGVSAGVLGDAGVFSFYGNKTITTGEGGMVVTQDAALAERVNFLKNHGMSAEKRYYHPELGFNFRMTSLQAAIGLAQLRNADELIAKKRHVHARYRARLGELAGVQLQTVPSGHGHVPWLTAVVDDALATEAERDAFIARLRTKGVDSRPFFYPNHLMPAFAGHERLAPLPVTERISFRGLCLPSGAGLRDDEVDRCIAAYIAARAEL